jgi:L-2-hydroxyglutarate oxidase LhgO
MSDPTLPSASRSSSGKESGDVIRADLAVIGGGIVGLATAWHIQQDHPDLRIVLLEKEDGLARHQTGHNSGVVHSGIYYQPGSLKAKLCVEGVERLRAFCTEHGVRYERCGKVITATEEEEVPRLEKLYDRGVENGVPGLRLIDGDGIREIEPHAAGIAGIHSPNTAIVDYPGVCEVLGRLLEEAGARILLGTPVTAIHSDEAGHVLRTPRVQVRAERLLSCAGLHADRVARMAGLKPDVRIVPFRGEYWFLRPERASLVKGLIYPVPDPALPFLGVHLTRMVDGSVEAGPNAVPAFAREGYEFSDVSLTDMAETLTFPGALRLGARFWQTGIFEIYRSLRPSVFLASVRRLMPELEEGDLLPGGSGVRAQAVERQGKLVDDFAILRTDHSLHVLNAPSPAATASLAIGRHLADHMASMFA